MMPKERFKEAWAGVAVSMDAFICLANEATLEARNVVYHRQRLLECLEDWFNVHAGQEVEG